MTNHNDFTKGVKILIKGKSQKGKQRIKDFGNKWEIEKLSQHSNSILVHPINNTSQQRWIDLPIDSDMEILEIINNE